MSQVYQDDEWKDAKEPQEAPRHLTRAEIQSAIDRDYAEGRMALDDWRAVTDSLSEPQTSP